ncbi:MAG: L-serine ammonia-lyase, iron-sulfur-dependent, subunit alpha [Klebsiella aerogenes]|nr:L-serine ammonia-lyase, iron-sulfur-dependent, subunit alpha [Klebsiella aerogenes]
MNTDNASLYVKWLKQEVAPALGCTEPVAISFTAAYAAQYLDQPCTKISGFISANLYKNAMGVTIPGTTVCGVALAAAIGAFGGNPQKGLKTLEDITPLHVEMAQQLIANNAVDIAVKETPDFIHLDLTLSAGENICRVVVKGTHTNVVELYINGQPQPLSAKQNASARHETLPTFSLQQAYEFINSADFNDIRFILEAARLNSALAAEGKTKKYGLNINGTFADAVKNGLMSNDLLSKVIINTVAASDARMGGAPVVAYTRLSALCAASTAAMGAAAGMAWLFTRDINTINTAIINMVSDITGMICDGASNSCAMKVSSVVSSAFKAVLMAMQNSCAGANDGIVCADVEQTINNLCRLVIKPMALTDKEIISIMVAK